MFVDNYYCGLFLHESNQCFIVFKDHTMPKMKTNSGAKKRFSITGTGRVRRNRAFKNHILTHKTRKRKRLLRMPALVSVADEQNIKRLLCLR